MRRTHILAIATIFAAILLSAVHRAEAQQISAETAPTPPANADLSTARGAHVETIWVYLGVSEAQRREIEKAPPAGRPNLLKSEQKVSLAKVSKVAGWVAHAVPMGLLESTETVSGLCGISPLFASPKMNREDFAHWLTPAQIDLLSIDWDRDWQRLIEQTTRQARDKYPGQDAASQEAMGKEVVERVRTFIRDTMLAVMDAPQKANYLQSVHDLELWQEAVRQGLLPKPFSPYRCDG